MNEIKNFKGKVITVFTAEDEESAHITVHGTCRDNLNDILDIYEKDKEEFFNTALEDSKILDIWVRWSQSAKELVQCAMGMVRMFRATQKDINWALDIMDYASKDADLRKKNMQRYFNLALKREPDNDKLRLDMRKVIMDCIHQVQAITNTQSTYTRMVKTGKAFEDSMQKMWEETSWNAERQRRMCPGKRYHPAFIHPKTVTPPGEPVPEWPEAFAEVYEIAPEEKVYDPELHELVLPEGYVSEDGRIDDKTVIWHPETHEVEIGFVGETKEVWNYTRFLKDDEVWIPGTWEAEYQIRLYEQVLKKERGRGILEK